jgi:phage replication O-like protein O
MASPQKEKGYTPIANELLEALIKVNLHASQFAMILAIMRKTYGFNKKSDSISISQFMEMLGLSRRAVIYNLQDLEAKAIIFIRRERDGQKNNVNVIELNKDYDAWVVHQSAPQVVHKRALGGSAQFGTGVVHSSVKGSAHCVHPQKTLQKTITKDISKAAALQGKQWNELIDLFAEINPMYQDFYSNRTERAALESMASSWGYQKLLNTIKALPSVVLLPYAPRITKPSELKRDIGKLMIFYKQEQSKGLKASNVFKV